MGCLKNRDGDVAPTGRLAGQERPCGSDVPVAIPISRLNHSAGLSLRPSRAAPCVDIIGFPTQSLHFTAGATHHLEETFMGSSMQDQLLKAGLVNKKKVSQAGKKQRHKHRGGRAAPDQVTLEVKQAAAQQAERDRALNLKQQRAIERKALSAQVKQLIESHGVPFEAGEVAYHFTIEGKIRTLDVTPEVQRKLGDGQLLIARYGGRFHLVPTEVAEKIRERAPRRVMDAGPTQAQDGEDDPYAKFEVPDDLVW